ncbi:NAD-dependent epimerase/dehydratase family protein, partial [Patescibacteria group bacterium]|nr:NAD-dependent epimerase/dehydratase family protein [Patescibacteria group bacterium]
KKVMDGNNPIIVWGSGNQSRSFLHVRDFAAGVLLVTEKYAQADPVNIGHGKEIKMKELLKMIQNLAGIHNEVFYDISKPEGYPRRAADISKLKRVTGGFVPSTPLEYGISEMIEEYKSSINI